MSNSRVATRIGDNVRAELARRRVSQSVLADHLGLTQTQVSRRLRGLPPFGVDELHAVATFLDVPVASLMDSPLARTG